MQTWKKTVGLCSMLAMLGAGAAVAGSNACAKTDAKVVSDAKPAMEHPDRGMGPMGPMFAGLNLTDEQKQEIKVIMQASRASMKDANKAMREARKAQMEAVQADEFNEKAIRDASSKVAQLEADIAVARAKMMGDVKKVLTPEQRQTLKDQEQKMGARMDKMMQGGRPDMGRMMKGMPPPAPEQKDDAPPPVSK